MNILFCGDWDIAGSSIASRLIREGNKVCWITEETKRDLWNEQLKGTVYRGKRGTEEYLHILRLDAVDAVIFMTGNLREDYDVRSTYESCIENLKDVLSALQVYRVKNFIYLSSIETDFKHSLTPSLAELAAGEEICNAYHKTYDIPLLVVKFGCVYGDVSLEDMGYIGSIIEKLKTGKSISSRYSAGDYVDAIYGEDLGMAVKSLLDLGKVGTYRILTGQRLSMEELYNCLGTIVGCQCQVSWIEERRTENEEYFTQNNRVKLETGWMPFYLLKENGKEIIKKIYQEEVNIVATGEEQKKGSWKEWLSSKQKSAFGAVFETLILYAAICFIIGFQKDINDLKYVDIRLLYVALIAAIHGTGMGLLAVALGIISYVYGLVSANVDPSYLIYSVDTWIPLVVYIIAGVVIGYITDHRLDEQETANEQYHLLSEKHEFLKILHGTSIEIKNNLQDQIVLSKQNFGKFYDVIVELDVLKPDLILLKVINIIENLMMCDKVAVYMFSGQNMQFARLKACSQNLREEVKSSLNMKNIENVIKSFEREEIFINKGLLPEYPDYAVPVYFHGEVYGFIALYQIASEGFTVYYQNLLKILTRLIERQLVKALEYENDNRDDMYYPGTKLLCPNALMERLELLHSSKEYAFYTFVHAKAYPINPMDRKEATEKLSSMIRGSDSVGIDQDGNYVVIFINAVPEQMGPIADRFEKKGFRLEVE